MGDGGAPRPAWGEGSRGVRRWREGFGVRVGGALSRAGGSRTAPTTGVGRTRAGVMRRGGGAPFVWLRQAQGERIWEGRVRWGVGDAMGDGDALRLAPALGSRESGNDDGGCGGMRWREGFGSGWVARSRGRAVREPPLRPGSLRSREYARGAPSCALSIGLGRSRRIWEARRATGGAVGCPQDRLRQAQGERIWEGRLRGVGDAMGDGDALRRAPALGSRESGNDGWRGRYGATSGGGILRLGRMLSPGPGRRPIRSPRWRRRGRGRCRR